MTTRPPTNARVPILALGAPLIGVACPLITGRPMTPFAALVCVAGVLTALLFPGEGPR